MIKNIIVSSICFSKFPSKELEVAPSIMELTRKTAEILSNWGITQIYTELLSNQELHTIPSNTGIVKLLAQNPSNSA